MGFLLFFIRFLLFKNFFKNFSEWQSGKGNYGKYMGTKESMSMKTLI